MSTHIEDTKKRDLELSSIPVFFCTDDGKGGDLSFVCPHCRTLHTHSSGSGHRVAHCHVSGSPFRDTGYILRRNVDNMNRY